MFRRNCKDFQRKVNSVLKKYHKDGIEIKNKLYSINSEVFLIALFERWQTAFVVMAPAER